MLYSPYKSMHHLADSAPITPACTLSAPITSLSRPSWITASKQSPYEKELGKEDVAYETAIDFTYTVGWMEKTDRR